MGKACYGKFLVLLVFGIIPAFRCIAQCRITFELNAPRDGERLRKTQVDVVSQGERGSGAVWVIQEPEDTKEYTQDFSVRDDSIVCREHNTAYSYRIFNDSIVLTGFRNRTTRMDYIKPSINLMNGIAYGDSIHSDFMAKGKYCDRLNIGLWGRSYIVADAEGTIINGKDTLNNVLRLHHRRDFRRISDIRDLPDTMFTDTYLRQSIDSLPYDNVREDRYVWYRPGNRYPVMETVFTSHLYNDSVSSKTATTFLYLPEEQRSDLNTDLVNEKVLEHLNSSDGMVSGRKTHDGSGGMAYDDSQGGSHDEFPVMADARLNADGSQLLLEYVMKDEGELRLGIYTDGGAMLAQRHFGRRLTGAYSETIHLAKAIRSGNALINIVFGEKNKVIKINKDGTL